MSINFLFAYPWPWSITVLFFFSTSFSFTFSLEESDNYWSLTFFFFFYEINYSFINQHAWFKWLTHFLIAEPQANLGKVRVECTAKLETQLPTQLRSLCKSSIAFGCKIFWPSTISEQVIAKTPQSAEPVLNRNKNRDMNIFFF